MEDLVDIHHLNEDTADDVLFEMGKMLEKELAKAKREQATRIAQATVKI